MGLEKAVEKLAFKPALDEGKSHADGERPLDPSASEISLSGK